MADLELGLVQTARRRQRTRGVTLIEVLIVVAILAMVSASVGIAAWAYHVKAQRRMAETNARALRATVKAWWLDHETSECPTFAMLLKDGAEDKDAPRTDPWGGEWNILCADNDVTIVSKGNDRRLGTDDDIRTPPA